jgi:hypothetical protein
MDKKAATHVVAFLLSDGAIKMANSVTVAGIAVNYTPGETRGRNMVSCFPGLGDGY